MNILEFRPRPMEVDVITSGNRRSILSQNWPGVRYNVDSDTKWHCRATMC